MDASRTPTRRIEEINVNPLSQRHLMCPRGMYWIFRGKPEAPKWMSAEP